MAHMGKCFTCHTKRRKNKRERLRLYRITVFEIGANSCQSKKRGLPFCAQKICATCPINIFDFLWFPPVGSLQAGHAPLGELHLHSVCGANAGPSQLDRLHWWVRSSALMSELVFTGEWDRHHCWVWDRLTGEWDRHQWWVGSSSMVSEIVLIGEWDCHH
jgi:hypothetical protein